jgi:voltage-gated potassium channel
MTRIKLRVYEVLEVAKPGDKASRVFDIFIISLIFLNVLAVIFQTVQSLAKYEVFFNAFEIFSVAVFTMEYILRVWSCDVHGGSSPIRARIQYMLSPLAIVDLIAILPFYLPMLIPFDLRFVRALRLVRLFRLFKVGRYSNALKTLSEVLKSKKEELLVTIFMVFILLIIASSLMYYVEKEVQQDAFPNIPAAMWWAVATLTTVGYGDVYPVTVLGKILGSIISLLGVGLFALPAGILASGFAEEIKKNEKVLICPHCNRRILDHRIS